MTTPEIWELIVRKTDHQDRNRLRLLAHSTPEDWITRLLAAATAHLDDTSTANPSTGAQTHARARR